MFDFYRINVQPAHFLFQPGIVVARVDHESGIAFGVEEDRTAKLYIGAVENRYLTGEVRRKVIFGLYKLPMESWSPGIVKVTEKDYADGYLKGGYRKTPITRLFNWIMRTFHMSFMIHLEFRG